MVKRLGTSVYCNLTIVLLAIAGHPTASQSFFVTSSNLGGGVFEYDIHVNDTFHQPLAGLLLFNAGINFGLNLSSVIGAPPGWDYLAPIPPFVEQLSYFSLTSASDIPIGGTLDGFTFQSSRDPSTVTAADFPIGFVDSKGDDIPEPSTFTIFGMGTISLLGYARHRRKRTR